MSLEEFTQLFHDADLFHGSPQDGSTPGALPAATPTPAAAEQEQSEDELGPRLTHRAINICFNLSMMTNKLETENDKHLNMTYVEFLEAFARVIDRLEARSMEDFFYHYPALSPWKLDKKLESALLIVFKACLPKKQYLAAYNKYNSTIELELDMIEAGELPPRK